MALCVMALQQTIEEKGWIVSIQVPGEKEARGSGDFGQESLTRN